MLLEQLPTRLISALASLSNTSRPISDTEYLRIPSRFCHSELIFLVFPFYILYTPIVCLIIRYFCLYLPPPPDHKHWNRRAVFCSSLYLSQCNIVPRCHIGLQNPGEFLEFGENFIHLHIGSFHSVLFSWIYFRKWPCIR